MGLDALGLKGVDHVRFYVGNAKQAAAFYKDRFGFKPVAYKGLETDSRDVASHVIEQGLVRFVLSSAYAPDHEITRHCALHGDAVKSIALEVENVDGTIEEVKKRGATVVSAPQTISDDSGEIREAAIRYTGDMTFTFIDRSKYKGAFAPSYNRVTQTDVLSSGLPAVGIKEIDHIVTNTHLGEMDPLVRWFERIMGFENRQQFTIDDIATEYSALMSKVMQNGKGSLKFPINEPAAGRPRKSQIKEFLDYNGELPGIQHIALTTDDIISTVHALRSRGVGFLRVPPTYYNDSLRERVGDIKESMDALAENGILIDRDEDGYLLQLFTKPVTDRPTLFFEIIQRHGSNAFGKGNFQALFQAIEREQKERGNL